MAERLQTYCARLYEQQAEKLAELIVSQLTSSSRFQSYGTIGRGGDEANALVDSFRQDLDRLNGRVETLEGFLGVATEGGSRSSTAGANGGGPGDHAFPEAKEPSVLQSLQARLSLLEDHHRFKTEQLQHQQHQQLGDSRQSQPESQPSGDPGYSDTTGGAMHLPFTSLENGPGRPEQPPSAANAALQSPGTVLRSAGASTQASAMRGSAVAAPLTTGTNMVAAASSGGAAARRIRGAGFTAEVTPRLRLGRGMASEGGRTAASAVAAPMSTPTAQAAAPEAAPMATLLTGPTVELSSLSSQEPMAAQQVASPLLGPATGSYAAGAPAPIVAGAPAPGGGTLRHVTPPRSPPVGGSLNLTPPATRPVAGAWRAVGGVGSLTLRPSLGGMAARIPGPAPPVDVLGVQTGRGPRPSSPLLPSDLRRGQGSPLQVRRQPTPEMPAALAPAPAAFLMGPSVGALGSRSLSPQGHAAPPVALAAPGSLNIVPGTAATWSSNTGLQQAPAMPLTARGAAPPAPAAPSQAAPHERVVPFVQRMRSA
eukprot:TRINITY_DN31533_c0_g3_i2.p1 TRINITY_DN31533_c0_g3~~TRINITY_DN31533_c0_g3_i2.p1  ORF type:complete len:539 (+),score=101.24 TRINITY_DN31533_c0_g3_i2:203-1819(+)